MKTWVRKTLSAGILAAGALLLAPSAAQADAGQDVSGILNNNSVLSDNQLTGNALSLLGGAANAVGVVVTESTTATEGRRRGNGGHGDKGGHGGWDRDRGRGHGGGHGHSQGTRCGFASHRHLGFHSHGHGHGGFIGSDFGGSGGFRGSSFGGGFSPILLGPSMGTVPLGTFGGGGFLGDVPIDDDIDGDDVVIVPGATLGNGNAGGGNATAPASNGYAGTAPASNGYGAKPAKVKPAKIKPAKVKPAKVKPAKVKPAKVKPATNAGYGAGAAEPTGEAPADVDVVTGSDSAAPTGRKG